MLTQAQLQRFAYDSGIRDLQIAEKEVVLTYMLEMLSERGFLADVAFKGGTCIRKTWLGADGRFSTDLDFTTLVPDREADDFVLKLAGAVQAEYHAIQFEQGLEKDRDWYASGDGTGWGAEPRYRHALGEGAVRFQVSHRETPTLEVEERAQLEQRYFKLLPFRPAPLRCLRIEEILAEKIRAAYQRDKPRDLWDLDRFASRHLPGPLIRKLVVVKLWQVKDGFNPARWREKLDTARRWDWDDLRMLVRGGSVNETELLARCSQRFAFLESLEQDEAALAGDTWQKNITMHRQLVEECRRLGATERVH